MAEPGTVVVTGANGFVGTHLVRSFDEAGWTVRALVHRVPETRRAGVTYERWELGQDASGLLDGADVLIHAAFVPYDRPGASEANVRGASRLLSEARAAGVGRTVFLSSMSARPGAESQYGRDKAAIAATFDRPTELVVRPGLVLGDGGLFDRMRSFMRRRRIVPLVGGGRQSFQTVYVEDLTAAIGAAIERGLNGTITIAEPAPVRFRDLLAEIARQDGVHVLFVPVPYVAVRSAMKVASVIGLHLPVSRDNLAGLRGVETEDVTADLERLGVVVRDYRASLRTITGEETR